MSLESMRDSIVAALAPEMGSATKVEAHGGRFTLQELKRRAQGRVSVPVACLGVISAEPGAAGTNVTAAWGAYVVCGDRTGISRDTGALSIVTALLPLIAGNEWGREDVDAPQRIRADNLYSSQLDKSGVALWAVTWRQEIILGRVDPATLDDLLHVHVDYDIAAGDGEPVTRDDIQLQGGTP